MTDHVDAPSTRPEFVIPVRPAGVPPGLCELRPDIHVVGIEPHGAHYTTAGKLANHIQGTIERQAAGRFYLWEAAQILADSHGKSLEGIRDAMRRAVSLGALCVRVVGSDEPMSAGSRLRIDGMDSYVTPEGLNEWLEADRYPYRFPVAAAPSASPAACPDAVAVPEPLQRQRHQEGEILRVLRELGHDPAALPARQPGKPGAKAAAWGLLQGKKRSRGVFDKAWERLRRAGEIVGG